METATASTLNSMVKINRESAISYKKILDLAWKYAFYMVILAWGLESGQFSDLNHK